MIPIVGWEGHYAISEDGIVWSLPKKNRNTLKPLKSVIDHGVGYKLVTLCVKGVGRRNAFIHRLLALHFIPNPDNKPMVNHIDGDKLNNSLSNLEWATASENSQHAVATGLTTTDATDVSVVQIDLVFNSIINEFKSLHEANRITGVAWQNIWKVCNDRRRSAGGYYWKYKHKMVETNQ